MKVVEVTRSVSRKVNLGRYETKDFFCSMKVEVDNEKEIEKASRFAHKFCDDEVVASIKELKEKLRDREAERMGGNK